MVINSIGNIYASIKNSSHKVEIDELSSGEKQLVIIIANMVFSRKNDINSIIIDEPEISLHIKWQDMFISALREINSNIQLILATHSPDIIGEYDDYCTPIERWGI
ncbi:AAA family ATPase [Vibrio azureus]|uniref:AAA family ATPase n=1 Tax=Vibrio azureus TaxID=512649 RepID=UPI000C7C3FB8